MRRQWGPAGPAPGRLVFQARKAAVSGDLEWDFQSDVPAGWPEGAVILHLAGPTRGTPDHLDVNVALARGLARAAVDRGARHVVFASTAAVYRPRPGRISEDIDPDPVAPYGRAKRMAEQALAAGLEGSGVGLTCLRIGNVAGADALLGGAMARPGQVVTLDPVPGQAAGPVRSYVGPQVLARVLAGLVRRVSDLPAVLNLAQPGPVAMADLLDAAGLAWRFGPPNGAAVARVVLDTARLEGLLPVEPASPAGLVADLSALRGAWP